MAEKRKLRIGPLTTVGQVAGELGRLYRQATQSAKDDEESVALPALSRIESRIAATPAEGPSLGSIASCARQVSKLIRPMLTWYV
jgi:hypothetical protein